VLGFVIQNLVVDFIGEDDQVVLASDLDDLQQQLFAIDRARRVVRAKKWLWLITLSNIYGE